MQVLFVQEFDPLRDALVGLGQPLLGQARVEELDVTRCEGHLPRGEHVTDDELGGTALVLGVRHEDAHDRLHEGVVLLVDVPQHISREIVDTGFAIEEAAKRAGEVRVSFGEERVVVAHGDVGTLLDDPALQRAKLVGGDFATERVAEATCEVVELEVVVASEVLEIGVHQSVAIAEEVLYVA